MFVSRAGRAVAQKSNKCEHEQKVRGLFLKNARLLKANTLKRLREKVNVPKMELNEQSQYYFSTNVYIKTNVY